MDALAIKGGTPIRTQLFPAWPAADQHERAWLEKVLAGSRWFAAPAAMILSR